MARASLANLTVRVKTGSNFLKATKNVPVIMSPMEVDNEDHDGEEDGELVEGERGEDREESEYEVEAVLDAKRGVFPNVCSLYYILHDGALNRTRLTSPQGRVAYLCKWKGYPDSENSWVDQQDAQYAFITANFHQVRANITVGPLEMH